MTLQININYKEFSF